MWNLRYDTDRPVCETNRITDIENCLVVAKGEGVGRGLECEVGVSKYKLLYIDWINAKVLLYNTENYIQYLTRSHSVSVRVTVALKGLCSLSLFSSSYNLSFVPFGLELEIIWLLCLKSSGVELPIFFIPNMPL